MCSCVSWRLMVTHSVERRTSDASDTPHWCRRFSSRWTPLHLICSVIDQRLHLTSPLHLRVPLFYHGVPAMGCFSGYVPRFMWTDKFKVKKDVDFLTKSKSRNVHECIMKQAGACDSVSQFHCTSLETVTLYWALLLRSNPFCCGIMLDKGILAASLIISSQSR